VRPKMNDEDVWERDTLLWSFLLRSIQTHGYIHSCTLVYCLAGSCNCRFHFPWPEAPTQQYDETKERIELARPHGPDDRWVVPHNLELAAFSPATVNVMLFDPEWGAEESRQYAGKYAGKPEPWYYLESTEKGGEANPVKRFLKARNVGMCMAVNRILGFHVVRSTVPTQFIFPQFVSDPGVRIARLPDHCQKYANYPAEYYLFAQQKYLFRPEGLRGLRIGQFVRYFTFGHADQWTPPAKRTDDDTMDATAVQPDVDAHHRHHSAIAEDIVSGEVVRNEEWGNFSCRRRQNARLCVPRSAFIEPLGPKREDYYEQKLFEGLPWFCTGGPEKMEQSDDAPTWLFDCHPSQDLDIDFRFAMRDRHVLDDNFKDTSFEQLCLRCELELGPHACECCAQSPEKKVRDMLARKWLPHVCERGKQAGGVETGNAS
jgi:hypothetical protein